MFFLIVFVLFVLLHFPWCSNILVFFFVSLQKDVRMSWLITFLFLTEFFFLRRGRVEDFEAFSSRRESDRTEPNTIEPTIISCFGSTYISSILMFNVSECRYFLMMPASVSPIHLKTRWECCLIVAFVIPPISSKNFVARGICLGKFPTAF